MIYKIINKIVMSTLCVGLIIGSSGFSEALDSMISISEKSVAEEYGSDFTGEGNKTSPYVVNSGEGLLKILKECSLGFYSDKYISLLNSLNVSGSDDTSYFNMINTPLGSLSDGISGFEDDLCLLGIDKGNLKLSLEGSSPSGSSKYIYIKLGSDINIDVGVLKLYKPRIFFGELDGNGHTIRITNNKKIEYNEDIGLIDLFLGGSISNLNLNLDEYKGKFNLVSYQLNSFPENEATEKIQKSISESLPAYPFFFYKNVYVGKDKIDKYIPEKVDKSIYYSDGGSLDSTPVVSIATNQKEEFDTLMYEKIQSINERLKDNSDLNKSDESILLNKGIDNIIQDELVSSEVPIHGIDDNTKATLDDAMKRASHGFGGEFNIDKDYGYRYRSNWG